MKIAYFVASIYFGGVEKIVTDSINALSTEHETLLIVPKGCEFKDKISQKVQIYEYKNYDKRWNLLLYFEIYKILSKFGVEILHTHGAKATQMGFVLNKFLKFSLVGTKHNARKGKIFEHIKNCLCVSKMVQNSIQNESRVLYFGIKPLETEKTNLAKEPFIITAVGRLDAIKGFDELIMACAKLKIEFVLQIIGKGTQLENLQILAENLGILQRVKFVGFSNEIPQILSSSHLQVISSKSEGLPLVLIEGLFYSPVLISTDVGGIGEILDSEFLMGYDDMAGKITQIYENYEKKVLKFSQIHAKIKTKLLFENYISNLQNYYKEILCRA